MVDGFSSIFLELFSSKSSDLVFKSRSWAKTNWDAVNDEEDREGTKFDETMIDDKVDLDFLDFVKFDGPSLSTPISFN